MTVAVGQRVWGPWKGFVVVYQGHGQYVVVGGELDLRRRVFPTQAAAIHHAQLYTQ